jgi:uncharacterized membrane protein
MTRRMWIAVISLAGLFIGIYLTLYHYGMIGTLVCGVSSCEQVQTSRWAMFLGVPIATWGAAYYALMLIVSMARIQPRFEDSAGLTLATFVLACWGMIFSAWLNYLEAFVIHAWCEWCLTSTALVLLMFALAFLEWRDYRRAGVVDLEGAENIAD